MTTQKAQATNSQFSTGRNRGKAKSFFLFSLVALGLPVVGLFIYSVSKGDIGWERIYVESSKQTKTFSVGEHKVNLSIGTYGDITEEEFRQVDINVSSDKTLMPTLEYRHSYEMLMLSEDSPGVYRLKDVDGDRTKDFVVRMGSDESRHKFYYISSRDGKGYQTDSRFQSSQPWVASEPHW